jgi:tRNA(Ile)-lysidine synthase
MPLPCTDDTLERFVAALDRDSLLRRVRRLLVGVSGGADSTALALLFKQYSTACKADCPELFIGHVHHGIRGADADDDEAFVRGLAGQLELPCRVKRVSAPELAERRGLSIEQAARVLRYDAFRDWAGRLTLDAVALAHQREDQQETLFFRLVRGTGLPGLRGIPVERSLRGCGREVRIIRPLLGWSRREILDYLERRGHGFRKDASNDSPRYARNVIRNQLLPLLEERVHPGARTALERLAAHARQLTRDLEVLALRAWREALVQVTADTVILDQMALARWPPSVVREVFVHAISHIAPERSSFSAAAWRPMRALLTGRGPRSVDAGGGVLLDLRYGHVSFRRRRGSSVPPTGSAGRRARVATEEAAGLAVEIPLCSAAVEWKGWLLGADRAPWTGATGEPLEEWIDADVLRGGLRVRSRRAGDVFHPLGAPGRKKLKEFLRESRIHPALRDDVPLVVSGDDGDDIVWVVGERLDHRYRIRPETHNTLRLYARRQRSG